MFMQIKFTAQLMLNIELQNDFQLAKLNSLQSARIDRVSHSGMQITALLVASLISIQEMQINENKRIQNKFLSCQSYQINVNMIINTFNCLTYERVFKFK